MYNIYYNVIELLQLTNNHHFKFHESHSVAAVVVATSQYCIELGGYWTLWFHLNYNSKSTVREGKWSLYCSSWFYFTSIQIWVYFLKLNHYFTFVTYPSMVNMVNGKALSHIQGPGPCPILNLKFHIQLNKNRVWFVFKTRSID